MNSDSIDHSENNEKGRTMFKNVPNNRNKIKNKRKKCDNTENDAVSGPITNNVDRIVVKTLPFHKFEEEDTLDHKKYREIMEKFCSKIQDYHHNGISCLFDSRYSYIYEAIVQKSNDSDF